MQYHYGKPGLGIDGYRSNRSGDIPEGCIKTSGNKPPPHYDWILDDFGAYQKGPNYVEPLNEDDIEAERIQLKMIDELSWADIEIKKHNEGHSRTVSTIDNIYTYKNQCRDHVRSIDGKLKVFGDTPVRPK